MKKYPYAVFDGNQTQSKEFPYSVHMTYAAAEKEAKKQNRGNPNLHYVVVEWGATANARAFVNELRAI